MWRRLHKGLPFSSCFGYTVGISKQEEVFMKQFLLLMLFIACCVTILKLYNSHGS